MNPRALYLALFLLLLPAQCSASEAALYITPENGEYAIGDTFALQIVADTGGDTMNAAEAEMDFNPQAIAVTNISTDGSIMKSWPSPPEYSNDRGRVQFAGWTDHNYTGSHGLLLTVTFKALHEMTGAAFLAEGAILAADGKGSNILTSMRSAKYTVGPKKMVDVTTSGILLPDDSTSTDGAQFFDNEQPLVVPILTDYPTSAEAGDHIIIRGKTSPNSRVSVWIEKGDDDPKDSSVMTASDGSFVFISDDKVENDVLYRMWAEVHSTNDVHSELSKKVTLMVHPKGIEAVAAASASIVSSILPLLLLLIFAGLGSGYLYHWYKLEKIRRGY